MDATSKARSPADRPAFLITIDTEGDDLWSASGEITTENARFLPRFQELCEKHGFLPTWLTSYEMAESPVFREFGRDVVERGAGEIGMHLHAWNSPPLVPLTDDDRACRPYLIEYPDNVIREKIAFLTQLLEDRFERPMLSHRAGRWALDSLYARQLVLFGYRVDCSVTPHRNWAGELGDPHGLGGTDYTDFPSRPYFVDLDRIDRPGDSPLLEVPVSILNTGSIMSRLLARTPSPIRRGLGRFFPSLIWLRPNGHNRSGMLRILRQAGRERWPCVEFMLHSSELMPGGSRKSRTPSHLERLYDDIEAVFSEAADAFAGAVLSEFRETYGSAEK
ncbi:MAG TPA: hypothetical protein VMY42_08430 [Thermoguttaceae bacterium]|nr:hypothetical protein [Thermoguttaceae bacterium]